MPFWVNEVTIKRDGVKNYIITMPRKARIDYAGLTHHVMANTFSDHRLFINSEDRKRFLFLLSKRIIETGFRCYAWVLMDTHYHLLVKTSDLPLWKLMKPLNTDYARYFNAKYNRRGPLFADRYKSIATQDQNYLQELVRYIHLNPLRAGICKNLDHLDRYPWCGHSSLVGFGEAGFQDRKTVLRCFGKSIDQGIERYREFLLRGSEGTDLDKMLINVRMSNNGHSKRTCPGSWVIGDSEFQQAVIAKDRENRLTLAKYKKMGLTLEKLQEMVAQKMNLPAEMIVTRSKRTPWARAKMVFCHFALKSGFPTIDIGAFLSLQQAAVSNAARKGLFIAKNEGIALPIM